MLIMLVENNIDKLRNLQRYVSECYTDSDIMPFSDSSDAMQFIQSDRFSVDLCFTAVVMRGVSGFELTAELRNHNKTAKKVLKFLPESDDLSKEGL
ncbi:MAG: response regulator [Clostridiales bacterium]|nr:response regulator [Clostridiales bacterium]